ncbi:hypothetical protein UFOVP629_85 [uncultured Caudovirales phage]|uniref:Uncharacterized protein n=1 Tax=uncultured Caudovirales phage TaxID=2100421 RepID=A0A6J5NFX1_9CAUD|nr:hypothetical protein UFOVP629_85 [uncultured Caudovirales phage]
MISQDIKESQEIESAVDVIEIVDKAMAKHSGHQMMPVSDMCDVLLDIRSRMSLIIKRYNDE